LITADITFYAHYTEIIIPPTPQPADEPDVIETSVWWNMSDDDFKSLGTLTADTAIRQLHITARPKAAVSVDGNNKTIDGISFTHRLKYGGSGSDSARVVWFDVKGACTIDLYLMSSSSGSTRTLNIASASLSNIITTMPAATTIGKQSYSYTGEQTRLYLYPDNGGINVYGIRLTYPADPPTEVETITNNQSPITNKLIMDGHLLIHHDDHYYNAQGQLLK